MGTIPDAVARRLVALAWHRSGPGPLAEALAPYVASPSGAGFLASAFYEARLRQPDEVPQALPNDESLPPATTPWSHEHAPYPGVDTDVKFTCALAWRVIEGRMFGALRDDEAAVRRMQALLEPVPVIDSDARRRLFAWVQSGSAIACVRAASEPVGSGGWLEPQGIARLLVLAGKWKHPSDYDLTDQVEREAFRLLVCAGMEPGRALDSLRDWNPWNGELPNGQWIPSEWMPRTPSADVCISGVTLAPSTLMRVRQVMWRSIPRATQMLSHACGITRDKASQVIAALGSGWSVELAMDDHRPAPPARASRARTIVNEGMRLLLADYPLHWAILAQASLRESKANPTMWVSSPGDGGAPIALSYSPAFVESLHLEECAAVLLHEIHHLIFDHLQGPPAPGRGVLTEMHQFCWTLATECTANEFIHLPLPYEPILLDALGLPRGESTVDRYHKLLRNPKRVSKFQKLLDEGEKKSCGRGKVGPSPSAAEGVIKEALRRIGSSLDSEMRGALAGTRAGTWLEELERVESSRLSWQELLQTRLRSMMSRQLTRTFPSRRAPEWLGVIPGRRARRTHPVVLIAVDTSGSMGSSELAAIMGEARRLMRMRVRVGLVQCDTEIQDSRWLRTNESLTKAHGRGGTSLEPPFKRDVLRKFRPDLLVYFTDGWGDAPAEPPRGTDVLWVLVGAYARVPAPWGRVVEMK